MTSEAIKKTIHALAFIQPSMVNTVLDDTKMWDALYEAHKRFECELRDAGFSWDAILHIERLGSAIYSKREQGRLEKSMLYWLA